MLIELKTSLLMLTPTLPLKPLNLSIYQFEWNSAHIGFNPRNSAHTGLNAHENQT